jgi:hypothetical protein
MRLFRLSATRNELANFFFTLRVPYTFKSVLYIKISRNPTLEQLNSIVVDALDVIRTGDFPRGANVYVPAVHAVVRVELEACAAI